MKKKGESYFWTSYSDLMTSLFFIMLMLFVLTIALLHSRMVGIEAEKQATQAELDRITSINKSIQKIDKNYFEYNQKYNRFTLVGIQVEFDKGKADLYGSKISDSERNRLQSVGQAMIKFMKEAHAENPDAEYLVIIEGQASSDPPGREYSDNDALSYRRALALYDFWEKSNLNFSKLSWAEVIISGSGTRSKFREIPELINGQSNEKNQRFVIHIIPKPSNMGDVK